MASALQVLFAAEQHPELRPLILRRFKGSGDLAQAVSLIENSNGILRAKELAKHHSLMAADMVRAPGGPEPWSLGPVQGERLGFGCRLSSLGCLLTSVLMPNRRDAPQIRQLPAAKSEHAAICRAALIKITERVLSRRK